MTTIEFLLYWVLPVIAIVYVIGYSALFAPLRDWSSLPKFFVVLLDCPMCIAFWVGLFVGFMNWLPLQWPAYVQTPILGALAGIGIQYLLEVFARSE